MFSLLVVERSSPVHRFITSAGICPSRLSVFLKGAPINAFLRCMYRSGLYFKIDYFVRKQAATHSICETHMKVFKITDAFGEKIQKFTAVPQRASVPGFQELGNQ